MDKGKNEIITVMVEGAGRLYKRTLKNTSKMFYIKYTVLVRFIYYTQNKTKQNKKSRNQTKKNRYVGYTVCSLSQSIKWRG